MLMTEVSYSTLREQEREAEAVIVSWDSVLWLCSAHTAM